jgi:hypothetical protein
MLHIEKHLLDSAAPMRILDDFPVRALVLNAAYQHQSSTKEQSQTQSNRPDQSGREAHAE